MLTFWISGTSLASKFLRASGITLMKVREETIKLLGKADMFYFSPEHPPLTEEAQRALDWAIDKRIKSGKFSNFLSGNCFGFLLHVYEPKLIPSGAWFFDQ